MTFSPESGTIEDRSPPLDQEEEWIFTSGKNPYATVASLITNY